MKQLKSLKMKMIRDFLCKKWYGIVRHLFVLVFPWNVKTKCLQIDFLLSQYSQCIFSEADMKMYSILFV